VWSREGGEQLTLPGSDSGCDPGVCFPTFVSVPMLTTVVRRTDSEIPRVYALTQQDNPRRRFPLPRLEISYNETIYMVVTGESTMTGVSG